MSRHHDAVQRIKGLRDVLIHGYAHVDVKRVWHIVIAQVPPLRSAVEHAWAERQAGWER